MNGRVYDPVLGKFLSADPNVQFEKSVTSYNRYSYVSNNPLKYTDPSGYFLKKLLQNISPQLATVISLALNFIPAVGPALSMMFNMMYAAANGASAGQIAFSMALSAAGSSVGGKVAGAYDLAANSFKYTVVQGAVAGAFTGGVNAAVGGGNIRRGILQGAASGAAMSGIQWKIRDSLATRLLEKRLDEMKYVLMQAHNDGGKTLQEIQSFKNRVTADQDYIDAVDKQIDRVKSQRNFNIKTSNKYSGSHIGSYIYNKNGEYVLETKINPNQASPEFGNPSPGLFNGSYSKLPDDIAGLVVATRPGINSRDILRKPGTFIQLSEKINAPVFVVPDDRYLWDSRIFEFNGNSCTVFGNGGSC